MNDLFHNALVATNVDSLSELDEASLACVTGGEMRAVSHGATNGSDGGSRDVAQAGSDYANAAY